MKLHALAFGLLLSSGAFAHEHGTIKIYDARFMPQIVNLFKPGMLVLEDGQKKTLIVPKNARILNQNFEVIRDFFAEEFGRKSWDNKGATIEASVNMNAFTVFDLLGTKQNAAWTKMKRFIFGAGSKKGLDQLEKALDVVGHEYTHAVIETSSNLKYEGQSGALNEHLADVFGVIINNRHNKSLKNPFLLGSSILYGELAHKAHALRDMMDPSKGLMPQPSHMNDLKKDAFKKFDRGCVPSSSNDHCGVHVLSGIPNKASALIMSAIGFEAAAPMFYDVMVNRLSENSNFADYRRALMVSCRSQASDVCGIVDDALKSVGI